jgi:hypothetical protein
MNPLPATDERWTRPKCIGVIGLILVLQIGLIFWLSDPRPAVVRKPAAAPALALLDQAPAAWLALENPALFALPQGEGFSGQSWFRVPPLPFHPFDWDEPPQWLVLQPGQLGIAFNVIGQTTNAPPETGPARPAPELTLPQVATARIAAPESNLRVEGDLAARQLLSTLRLPSWPGDELLTNTVIQVIVDPAGSPVSFTLLSRSGHKPADDFAVELARGVRFSPAPIKAPDRQGILGCLSYGTLVFSWQTIHVAATNLAATPR